MIWRAERGQAQIKAGRRGEAGKTASVNVIGTMAAAMSVAVTMTGAAALSSLPDPDI